MCRARRCRSEGWLLRRTPELLSSVFLAAPRGGRFFGGHSRVLICTAAMTWVAMFAPAYSPPRAQAVPAIHDPATTPDDAPTKRERTRAISHLPMEVGDAPLRSAAQQERLELRRQRFRYDGLHAHAQGVGDGGRRDFIRHGRAPGWSEPRDYGQGGTPDAGGTSSRGYTLAIDFG